MSRLFRIFSVCFLFCCNYLGSIFGMFLGAALRRPVSANTATAVLPWGENSRYSNFEKHKLNDDEGITSVSCAPLKGEKFYDEFPFVLFSGGKKGTISGHIICFNGKTGEVKILDKISLKNNDQNVNTIASVVKYPVHSMDYFCLAQFDNEGCNDLCLCCGCGDRYARVWKCTESNGTMSGSHRVHWEFSAKLGPHTGWVKSIVVDEVNGLMHTIGCNIVETWEMERNDPKRKWNHRITREIVASNDDKVATRSSDLLCLCCFGRLLESKNRECLLLAGGVDGRIHQWRSPSRTSKTPISTTAHQGRVNKLLCSVASGLLFSCSHDGCVQCRDLSHGGRNIEDAHFMELRVGKDDERLLAMALLAESESTAEVAVGTSFGTLYILRAKRKDDCSIELIPLPSLQNTSGGYIIHAMDVFRTGVGGNVCLALGHSGGLSLLAFHCPLSLANTPNIKGSRGKKT